MRRLFLYLLLLLLLALARAQPIVLRAENHAVLRGEITDGSARQFIRALLARPTPPAYVYIDSVGGDVDRGLAILRALPENVTCVAVRALSMAFAIFQHCASRVVLPTSVLMQHQIHLALGGDLARVRSYVGHVQRQNAWLLAAQAARLNVSAEWLDNRTRDDWWMFGDEAVRNRCADRIINRVVCAPLRTATIRLGSAGGGSLTSGCPLNDDGDDE